MSRREWFFYAFCVLGIWGMLCIGCASFVPLQESPLLPGWVEAITADTMSVAGKQYEVYEWSDGTDFVWFFRLLEAHDE